MRLDEAVIEGTLKSDGTLELDQKPSLAPGRVRVILQATPVTAMPKRGLVEVMDEIRRDQKARGYMGRTLEETRAEEEAREVEDEEYEQRCQGLWGKSGS